MRSQRPWRRCQLLSNRRQRYYVGWRNYQGARQDQLTNAIEQRAFLVRLCKDRFERQEVWERQKPPSRRRRHQPSNHRKARNQADILALRGMMACAYPSLKPGGADYCIYKNRLQKSMDEGTNWFKAQQRRPSITWIFPSNMSEKK